MNSFYCFQWENYGKPLKECAETTLIQYRSMPCTPMGDPLFTYPNLSSAQKAEEYLENNFWRELKNACPSIALSSSKRAELARSMLSIAGLQP